MPFFDEKIIEGSDHFTPKFLKDLNEVIANLEGRIVASLPIRGPSGLANRVRAYMQAHIRRSLEFLEAGRSEFYAGRRLVVQTCARAIYENVAALNDFEQRIGSLIAAGDLEAIEKFVDSRAFSTRIEELIAEHGEDLKATNILTLIDKMKSRYEPFRQAYDHVCEFVHPNSMGAVVHFIEIRDGVAHFRPAGKHPEWSRDELLASAFMLAFVEIATANIEKMLETLSSSSGGGVPPLQ